MSHECKWDVEIGKFKEFMESSKGTRALQWSMLGIFIVYLGTFLILWGGMTEKVKNQGDDIKFFKDKFSNIKLIGYVNAEEK
jgi:hypothetical protein